MEFRRVDVIWKGESAITEDYAFRPSRQSIMFSSQWNPPCTPGAAASAIHQQGESPAVLVRIVGCKQYSEQDSDGVLLLG